MSENIIQVLSDCGAPLLTFILGLFFPQVRLVHLLDVFRRMADKKE